MAGSAVLGYHRLHHNCQPLRPTPAEPEAVDGFLQYLASRLHHAGCHQRKRTRYYVLIYMFANLAVFTVITIVALRAGKFTLEDYNGLYTTNPKLAFLMTLALFSLAGIPPFAGFFSKFFIFAAAFEGGFHLLVFIALINTIISLYYYLKIVKAMYINKSDEPIAAFRSDNYTRASLAICTLGIVVLSIASVVYQSIDKFSFGL